MAHKVDAASPLWGMGRAELEACDCEFVVLLDGIDESTSTALQVRSGDEQQACASLHSSVPLQLPSLLSRWAEIA